MTKFDDSGIKVTPFERKAIEQAMSLHKAWPLGQDDVRKEIAAKTKEFFMEYEINIE